jgi:hypothetical protein
MNSPSMNNNLKIALIPALGLVLVYLVLRGRNGSEQSSVETPVRVADNETSRSIRSQEPTTPVTQAISNWQKFAIEDLPTTDPFDRRALFPVLSAVATPSDSNNTLVGAPDRSSAEVLKPIKIQAVFQSPSGITALVENRVIHIGDRLEDGSEVVGITPEQLLLVKPNIH